ncbi:cathepsin A (carboxypeptidase C) [Strigomonas culicis]|uniref:Cathepsin A (Carboxypeptidase C) n=1 Tax=Strigomonas culicis TaxID=28005 RepID=S9VNQ9_9TRYP|nr:cathepsin A (carboxypeptidase C) [Strigomonas culicis]|eukprot:EPY28611.1 cathepsin A (carboxypeptidase C) [Strigomonas culicis]
MPSYATLAYDWCKVRLGVPCITAAQHAAMRAELRACQAAIAGCNDAQQPFENDMCLQAGARCERYLSYYLNTSRSPHNIRGAWDGSARGAPPEAVTAFLARPAVRAALGVAAGAPPWAASSAAVRRRFAYDAYKTVNATVARLLEGGLRVWVYAGDLDYMGNWVGAKAWLRALQWPGAAGFAAAPDTEFVVDGRWAGRERTYGNLTFVQVYEAGHAVPTDAPAVALQIIEHFMDGASLSP